MIKSLKDVPGELMTVGGGPMCSGCPSAMGLKMALQVMGRETIIINSSGCSTLYVTYPHMPTLVPWLHNAIENAGSSASGVFSAMKAMGKKGTNILCWSGDGASYEIGFQSLSGAVSRGDSMVYVCYNNQCFSNTGVQHSFATPLGADTSTTPSGREGHGNMWSPKPMVRIMASHGIPYAATASLGYPLDFMNKVEKGMANQPAFIDLLCPCPPAWGFDHSKTMEIGKLAVDTGAWPLYEIEKGVFRLTHSPEKLIPVREYMKNQKRFRHAGKRLTGKIQKFIDRQWKAMLKGEYWASAQSPGSMG